MMCIKDPPLQLVRTEEASWMRCETSSKKLKVADDTELRFTVTWMTEIIDQHPRE